MKSLFVAFSVLLPFWGVTRMNAAAVVPELIAQKFLLQHSSIPMEPGLGQILYIVHLGGFPLNLHTLLGLQIGLDALVLFGVGYLSYRISGRLGGILAMVMWTLWPSAASAAAEPFYYYWPIPFSLAMVLLWDRIEALSGPLLALWALTRATALGLFPLVLLKSKKRALVVLCILPVVFLGRGQVWHDLYIGIGTRPNPYGIVHSDSFAMETAAKHGADFQQEGYEEALRDEYLKIARENPLLLVRNVLLNVVDSLRGWSFSFAGILWPAPLLTLLALLVTGNRTLAWTALLWLNQCITLSLVGRPIEAYLWETMGLFTVCSTASFGLLVGVVQTEVRRGLAAAEVGA